MIGFSLAKHARYFTNHSPAQEFYAGYMRKALEENITSNPATAVKMPLMRALVDAAARKHQEIHESRAAQAQEAQAQAPEVQGA